MDRAIMMCLAKKPAERPAGVDVLAKNPAERRADAQTFERMPEDSVEIAPWGREAAHNR